MGALDASWAVLKRLRGIGYTRSGNDFLEMPISCTIDGCSEPGFWSAELRGYYCRAHETEMLEPMEIPSPEPYPLDEDHNYTEPFEYNPDED